MSIADDWVAALEPWWTTDLETYLRAMATMFADVEELAFDTPEADGWSVLLDPDRIPARGLPWLAQFVGERLPVGIGEAEAREWLKDAPNRRRGTPLSIFQTAQRTLTGQRLVALEERADGDVDMIRVVTYTDETPDPERVERDLRYLVVPADIVLDYVVASGGLWSGINDGQTWQNVKDEFDTWADVLAARTGSNTYSRPRT